MRTALRYDSSFVPVNKLVTLRVCSPGAKLGKHPRHLSPSPLRRHLPWSHSHLILSIYVRAMLQKNVYDLES